MKLERWLPVLGFPDYEVSDRGRIRSLDRCVRQSTGSVRFFKGQILSAPPTKKGYLHTNLVNPAGIAKSVYVHQIVLFAFVGPRPDGMEVRHKNGKKSDCLLSNLCWGTKLENAADREKHGTHHRGEKSATAKLNDAKVRAIRAEYALGRCSHAFLGRKYGVKAATVYRVLNRKNWKHIA